MDDNAFQMLCSRLDRGSDAIQWLCKHTISMEAVLTEIKGDMEEVKELLVLHDRRIAKSEKQISYVKGGMAIIIIMFTIMISGVVP